MASLRNWFKVLRDILLSRYQLPSIRGICSDFDLIDSYANDLDLRIKMKCLSPESLHIFQKVQKYIQYGAIPIPDQNLTFLNEHMKSFEANVDRVEEIVEDMIDELLELLSEPIGGEGYRK